MSAWRLNGPVLALALSVAAGCTSVRTSSVPPSAPAPTPAPAIPAPARPAPPAPPRKETPPVLAPQVSGEEESRLSREATTRIQATEKAVGQLDPKRLNQAQQETLATIQDFLAKAREAMTARDMQRAFTLADKALALANDLSRSGR